MHQVLHLGLYAMLEKSFPYFEYLHQFYDTTVEPIDFLPFNSFHLQYDYYV